MKKIIIALMVLAGLVWFLVCQSGYEVVREELDSALLAELEKLEEELLPQMLRLF